MWRHRFPPAIVLGSSLMLAAIALAMLAQVGGAIVLPIVVTAPPERARAASGISEIGAELGGALGIAILGSLGTAVYRSVLSSRLPPNILSEAFEIARDTLGAVGIAEQAESTNSRIETISSLRWQG